MLKLNFSTKAKNLERLYAKLETAKILPLKIFTLSDLASMKKEEVCKEVFNFFGDCSLIIRSSSQFEDSALTSNAGSFLSVSNIPSNDFNKLWEALCEVAESLKKHDFAQNDEILLQTMLYDIELCGVGFSVDKDNFSPYFSIEYDKSGSHHSITDGSAQDFLSFTHFREVPLPKEDRVNRILKLIIELEEIFDCNHIDVEFAFSKGELYLFQVRPLVMEGKKNLYHCITFDMLKRFAKRFEKLQNRHFDILGSKTIFGVMPDWNPAEIIGLRPKRLALSLYKEIITDSVWAYQRDNYGYQTLRSHPLMHSFFGMPYIDVRLSFNSFIPKGLNRDIANKLVNYYLNTLEKTPHLHDKIEFDIVFSCLDFSSEDRFKKLLKNGFDTDEIHQITKALCQLTQRIIHPIEGLYLKDLAKVRELKRRYQDISNSDLPLIDRIYWLIENCKRYGTLPFAGVARAGFVAMQLLNSLVEVGVLSVHQRQDFLNSLCTISKQLNHDSFCLNQENKDSFIQKYGHLRAGTYDITSPCYGKNLDHYFDLHQKRDSFLINETSFFLDQSTQEAVQKLIDNLGFKISTLELFSFFKQAIEGREEVKFEFTKLLSSAIELIADLGEHYGISREEMAFLDIKSILSLYASLHTQSPRLQFLDEIAYYKKEYEATLALKLPALIRSSEEIFSFESCQARANFITQKKITANVASENDLNLKGKIVLIYAADPGFDYLFAKDIAGFVTCYGGSNSHMAIRASELGMPAVIGVGEEMFKKCQKSTRLEIDCQSEQILFL